MNLTDPSPAPPPERKSFKDSDGNGIRTATNSYKKSVPPEAKKLRIGVAPEDWVYYMLLSIG